MIRRAATITALLLVAGCSSTSSDVLKPQASATGSEATTTVAATVPAGPSETAKALSGKKTFGTSSQIPAVVNGEPITKLQVSRRAAFRKLRREKDTSRRAAVDELIEDTLKLQEGKRVGINVTPARIDTAYASFAKGNRMSVKQLNQVMNQSGVTPAGFKDFIRARIVWSSLLAQRSNGASKPLSEREAVARMLQDGGTKPTATEYMLQQVVFLVPENRRSKAAVNARVAEAKAMRSRFQNCESTFQFAKGLKDVTVRDLGRKLEPELPGDWKSHIVGLNPGQATKVRTTPRGAEFIGVCRAREVSDDRTAQLVFAQQDASDAGEGGGKAYLGKLRENAKIEIR